MRGRPPKPTQLRIVQGNPGKRPINDQEPAAPAVLPEPPDFLPDLAKEEWRRLGPLLEDSGLMSNLDRNAFAAYCTAFAMWAEAIQDVIREGKYTRSPSGRVGMSQMFMVATEAERRMTAIGAEFGLSPSSRSRIKVGGQEETDPLEAFLKHGPKATPG